MTTSPDPPVDQPLPAQPNHDLANQLRRAQLRLAGARRQLDERLQQLRELEIEVGELRNRLATLALVTVERDQARADLSLIRNSRTFRYSEGARRIYGWLRTRWAARVHR
jgi:hypothetical protein